MANLLPRALLVAVCSLFMLNSTSSAQAESPPPVLLLNAESLAHTRAAARNGDPSLQPALDALRHRADLALSSKPYSVTHKTVPPPSGDIHDYVSLSIYWWPDPASASSLPYIQRDGVRNPEADDTLRYDANPITQMVADVEVLSLAYFLTGENAFALRASELLHTWFLDPDTRMNPNFRYAQTIPGRDAVRGTGIIESRRFTRIVDSVALLQGCTCWSVGDQQALRTWFSAFGTWLRTSPNGQLEARTTNNHAVWYDVQLVDFALFAGDVDTARQVLSQAPASRIDTQINADGSMPRELQRTRSLHYSNFNLQAFAELATLAQSIDSPDLWTYESPATGASIRTALDFLRPYMTAPQTWPYDEITDVSPFQESAQTLSRAINATANPADQTILTQITQPQSPLDLLRLTLGYWPD